MDVGINNGRCVLREYPQTQSMGMFGVFDPKNKAAHSVQKLMSTSGMSSFKMHARFHETSTDKERLVVVETFEEAEGTQTYLVDLNKIDALFLS